jgi:hypothetical protein
MKGQYMLILPWLVSLEDNWSKNGNTTKLLFEAGVSCDIRAAELMLEQGAEWPSSYIGDQTVHKKSIRACWHYRAVAWALSKGCRWGEWRCQDLAPELYSVGNCKSRATGLFKWAHKNGCPCTCETAAADGAVVVA